MTLEQMRIRLQEIAVRLQELEDLIGSEKRDYIDEEKTEISNLLDEAEGLEVDVEREERKQSFTQKMQNTSNDQDKIKKKVTQDLDTDTRNYAMQVTQKGPKRGDPNRFFSSLGEQLTAVIHAGMGQRVDTRLYEVRAASGLAESEGHLGGFLLQPAFANQLLADIFETGVLASRVTRFTLSGNQNSIKIPGFDETSRVLGSRFGGVRLYYVQEAGEKTASKPKFRQIELTPNKLVGLCYLTDELLQDVAAMEQYVTTAFTNEFGFMIDEGIVNGSGVGEPLGIMNAGCLVTQTAVSGQGASTIVAKNVFQMWSRLMASSRSNAIWLVNQDAEPELYNIELSTGSGPLYIPGNTIANSPYNTLMGRPIFAVEHCQTLGTAGDLILGDFSKYVIADKGSMQRDMSIHVRFVYDESVLRFVYRWDGQPMRASALTPFKGSNTLSHFVVLNSTRT